MLVSEFIFGLNSLQMRPISKITKRLYVTNAPSVAKVSLLIKRRIKYVLTVMDEPLPAEVRKQLVDNNISFECVRFIENDIPSKQLQQSLESIASKINDHEQTHPMIIHCVKGQNRSPAAILYWLIAYKNMTFQNALEYLQSRRHILIDPCWLRKIKKMF